MKLIRHESTYNPTIKAKLKQMVQNLEKKTDEEKIAFIFKSETKFVERPYVKGDIVSAEIASYLKDLEEHISNAPYISHGTIPKEAISYIDNAYENICQQVEKEFTEIRKK